MSGRQVAADRSVDALSSVVLGLHTGQRRRSLLHVRRDIEQHGIRRNVQNIVFIRLDRYISRSDGIISKGISLEHGVIALGSILHLLLRELQCELVSPVLDLSQGPVRIRSLDPGVHI